MGMTKTPIADRFWRKVWKKGLDECWPWLGALDSQERYGVFVDDNRKCVDAHRVAYQLTHPDKVLTSKDFVIHPGKLYKGLTTCCNPAHFKLGDRKSCANYREKRRAERIRSGEEVRGGKLTSEDVLDILSTTTKQTRLAAKYGVSKTHIWNVVHGRRWKACLT